MTSFYNFPYNFEVSLSSFFPDFHEITNFWNHLTQVISTIFRRFTQFNPPKQNSYLESILPDRLPHRHRRNFYNIYVGTPHTIFIVTQSVYFYIGQWKIYRINFGGDSWRNDAVVAVHSLEHYTFLPLAFIDDTLLLAFFFGIACNCYASSLSLPLPCRFAVTVALRSLQTSQVVYPENVEIILAFISVRCAASIFSPGFALFIAQMLINSQQMAKIKPIRWVSVSKRCTG